MRVLLVGPALEDNLSLRYLASSLQAAGHVAELARFDGAADADAIVAAARGCELAGLSLAYQVRAREFLELARALRREVGLPVVAGGHYASCAAGELLRRHPELDLIVLHEGERTLVEVADALAANRSPAGMPGTACRDGADVVFGPARPMESDLDRLPPPDRRGPAHLLAGVPTAYLLGSRGCVGSCDYCCIASLHRLAPGPRFRQRDPGRIADEMAGLYHERGVRQFVFHDDNFLLPSAPRNLARLDALARAWTARGLDGIGLVIKARPQDLQAGVLDRLRELGLLRVFLGVESGSAAGLASLGRRQEVAAAEVALELCRARGISAQYTLMIFHPEATPATLRADLAFLRRHRDHAWNVCRAEAYAGTPLERRVIASGLARGDYLARSYRLRDPAADLTCRLALRLLRARCWEPGALMQQVIGNDQLAAVLGRFYAGAKVDRLRRELRRWRLDANDELTDLLGELLEAVVEHPDPRDRELQARVRDLARREDAGRRRLLARGAALAATLDALVRDRVGLERAGSLRPASRRRRSSLARHAAAVLLALGVAGAYGCNDGGGICEPAPPQLPDTDGDGLPDECEVSIFGTRPDTTDTDGDGILDGAEDSDGDGLTNRQEQDEVGPYRCGDVSP